jgi:hypothetical protein
MADGDIPIGNSFASNNNVADTPPCPSHSVIYGSHATRGTLFRDTVSGLALTLDMFSHYQVAPATRLAGGRIVLTVMLCSVSLLSKSR